MGVSDKRDCVKRRLKNLSYDAYSFISRDLNKLPDEVKQNNPTYDEFVFVIDYLRRVILTSDALSEYREIRKDLGEFTSLIEREFIKRIIDDPKLVGALVNLKNEKKSGILRAYRDPIIKYSKNLLRDENNDIRSEEFIGLLSNLSGVKSLYTLALEKDDAEAWEEISGMKSVQRVLDNGLLYKRLQPNVDSKMHQLLHKDSGVKLSVMQSYSALIHAGSKVSKDALLLKYNSDLAPDYGHLILRDILMRETGFRSPGFYALANRMVEDGADLFLAFKMAESKHFPAEAYINRRKAYEVEAEYMKNNGDLLDCTYNQTHVNKIIKMADLYLSLGMTQKDSEPTGKRERGVDTLSL